MQTSLMERRRPQAGITLIELLVAMIIMAVLSTMLVGGWISLQRSYASTVHTNNSRATARDALDRISSELLNCQPLTMATPAPTPTPTSTPSPLPPITVAQPMEVDFYSSYNQPGVDEGSGTGKLVLTRIWLDTATVPPAPARPQCKTLYWQRRPLTSPFSGAWTDTGVRTIVLAKADVVNNSVPSTSTPTAVFRYGYRDLSGNLQWTDNSGSTLDLTKIVAVQVRLIVDVNLAHTPKYVDISTTVRPRNASAN